MRMIRACAYRLQCCRRHHANYWIKTYINDSMRPILQSPDSSIESTPQKAKSRPKLTSTQWKRTSILGGGPLLHTWYVFLYQFVVNIKINTRRPKTGLVEATCVNPLSDIVCYSPFINNNDIETDSIVLILRGNSLKLCGQKIINKNVLQLGNFQ